MRDHFIFSSLCVLGPPLPLACARRKHLCRKGQKGSLCLNWTMPKSKTELPHVNIDLPVQFQATENKGSVSWLTWWGIINHIRVPRNWFWMLMCVHVPYLAGIWWKAKAGAPMVDILRHKNPSRFSAHYRTSPVPAATLLYISVPYGVYFQVCFQPIYENFSSIREVILNINPN